MPHQLVDDAPRNLGVPHNVRHAIVLTATALLLHFVWENVQCRALFVHGSYDATLWGMTVASAGDVALTWLLYGVVASATRRWRWTGTPWTWTQWLVLLGAALVVGIGIEWHTVATGRWAYADVMPRLFGLDIGLVPVLQLLVVPALSFAIAERLSPDRAHRPDETER